MQIHAAWGKSLVSDWDHPTSPALPWLDLTVEPAYTTTTVKHYLFFMSLSISVPPSLCHTHAHTHACTHACTYAHTHTHTHTRITHTHSISLCRIGKGIGYKRSDLSALVDGSTLVVGGKELEVKFTVLCHNSIMHADWMWRNDLLRTWLVYSLIVHTDVDMKRVPVFSPGPFSRVAPYAFQTSFPLMYVSSLMFDVVTNSAQIMPTRSSLIKYNTLRVSSSRISRLGRGIKGGGQAGSVWPCAQHGG